MVLLDTNALLLPFTSGVRLVPEITRRLDSADVRVPRLVLEELRGLERRGTPFAAAALALASAFTILESDDRGDLGLIHLAVREGAIVVTADRGLKDRLREAGVTVLFPRSGGHLDVARPRRPSRRATVKKRTPLDAPRRDPRR